MSTGTDSQSSQSRRERVSDRRKVLEQSDTGLQKWGLPAEVIVGGGSGALLIAFADYNLPTGSRWPAYVLAACCLVGAVISMFHSPDHLPTHEHVRRYITHHIRQHAMISARLTSTIAQPINDGILGMIFSRSLVENIRFVEAQGEERAQDAVQVTRPFHNSPAIETRDGGMIGMIKIRPAAMAVADKRHWETRVNRLANVIDSSVTSKVQFTSKMRSVDYGNRIGTYEAREEQLLSQLAEKHGSIDAAYEKARKGDLDEEDLGLLVSADLAEERQRVIDMYDVTTLKREYYATVRVDPEDVVTSETVDDGGGIENVPLLGRLWKHRRLHKIRKEGDHSKVLIERLESKLETLQKDLRTIEDIRTQTLSSTVASQVLADHYKAANAYAIADFEDLVRVSPKPVSSSGEDIYGVTYEHLDDLPTEHLGTTSDSGSDPNSDSGAEDDDEETSESRQFAERVLETNDNPIADVVFSLEQLIDHYQTIIGPRERVYRGDANYITIDNEVYSKTFSIRSWPAVPKMGILEPILREHEPGVAVNTATHVVPVDQKQLELDLEDTERTREQSLTESVQSRLPRRLSSLEDERSEAAEMIEANRDSEYDVFETNTHIELRTDDPEALGRTIEHVESIMNDEGAELKQETAYHYEGWQSVAPVCQDLLEEPVRMFADGVAREFPWTSRNLHEENGIEFGINMHTNEPLYLDLWNRKTGFDFGIFTKKGGGKTTTATEILGRLNSVYCDQVLTIVIDPLQEYANLATTNGGERIVVGGDTGINPFHIEETPAEKLATIGKSAPYKHWLEGCMDFVEMYYAEEGLVFGEKRGIWRMAIREAAVRYGIGPDPKTHSADYREQRYTEFYGNCEDDSELPAGGVGDDDHEIDPESIPTDVPSPDVNPRACPTPMDAIEIIDEIAEHPTEWVWSNPDEAPSAAKVDEREETAVKIINNDVQPFQPGSEYEHFTQQTNIDLSGSTFFYVDMQQQEASTSIGLTMQVVYDLFYELVKTIDIPSVIFMDEFHYMLRDSLAQKSLNQKFRHGRHWDLSLGIATQSFKDFFGEDADGNTHLTDNAQVLFENMPTQIFHKEDMTSEWAAEIGLTEDEAEFIRNAEPGNRELGYSTALLRVDDKGTYPLKVKMDFEENPREAIVTEFDPSEHGEDFYTYLMRYDDLCEWRFAPDSADRDTVIADTQVLIRGTDSPRRPESGEFASQTNGPQMSAVLDEAPSGASTGTGGDD